MAQSPTTQVEWILIAIDYGVTAAAILAATVAIAAGGPRGRILDLTRPKRPNRFSEGNVVAAVAAYFLGAFLLGRALQWNPQSQALWPALIVDNGARLAGSAVCLWVAAYRFHGGLRVFLLGRIGMHQSTVMPTVLVCVVAIGLCPIVADLTVWLLQQATPGFRPTSHPTIARLHEQDVDWAALTGLWLGAALVAPVAEELFFRGILQTFLVNVIRSRVLAVALVSLAFGVVHVAQPEAVPALILLSLLLGWAYERTGSLAAPAFIHIAFNLKTLIWDALGRCAGTPA